MEPTRAADVVLPVEVVTLVHLKSRNGEPVRVRCEAVDEVVITTLLDALPGGRPPTLASGDDSPEATRENLRLFNQHGPPLIEVATVLDDGNGGEVRPAFWFDPNKPRHAQSLPGRILRLEDRVLLAQSILRLSGYLGGAAGADFHGTNGEGVGGGVGTVAAGEGNGDETLRPDGAHALQP